MTITLTPNTSRRELKKQHAQSLLDLRNYAKLLERIKHFEGLKDAAAEKHRQITEPIQQQLRRADDDAVARIVDRLPTDPKVESRRQQLLEELEEANIALQNAIRDAEERAAPHRKALLAMAGDPPNPQVIESRLYRCGDPEKQARCEALGWIAKELQRLIPEVTKQRERAEAVLEQAKRDKYQEQVDLGERWRSQWAVTLEILTDFRDDARNEATTLREEIING